MKRILLAAAAVIFVLAEIPSALAGTSAGYHFAGSGERNVKVISSLSADWLNARDEAVTNWSDSDFINMTSTDGKTSANYRKKCVYTGKKIHLCNASYPGKYWAGLTQVTFESGSHHIIQVRARLNDAQVSTAHQRKVVACHELGHAIGLGHVDQSNANSCMTPVVSSGETPDAGNYDKLDQIYDHNGIVGESVTTKHHGPYTTVTIAIAPPA